MAYSYYKEEHNERFRKALLSVLPEYFATPTMQKRLSKHFLQVNKLRIERIFAYELYHQLRKHYQNSNHYVSGEFIKGLAFFPDYNRSNTIIPDIIIHQFKTTRENALAAEIKSTPSLSVQQILDDLENLELLTRPGNGALNFEIGILLIINYDFQLKFTKMRIENKRRIRKALKKSRSSIWNIAVPKVMKEHGTDSEIKLQEDCLKIYKSDDFIFNF